MLLAGTSILAGTEIYSTFRPQRDQQLFALTADQIVDIRASKAIFSVHGFIAYKDDFSIFGPKVTRFCVWFNPLNDATIGPFDNCGPGAQ
jgi:hypothetical protein